MDIYNYLKTLKYNINRQVALFDISLVKPHSINFSVTDRCNLSCKMCDIWKRYPLGELSLIEIKMIIIKLRLWLGPFLLNFTGGEPFLRKDMMEIINFCSQNDVQTSITTNGTLINKGLAKKILNSRISEIYISLDSLKPKVHDYLRNKKGTFEKVHSAIHKLNPNNRRFLISIATIVMNYNLEDLPDMVNLIHEENLHMIILQPLFNNFGSQYNPFWYKNSEFWPRNYRKLDILFDQLIRGRKNGLKINNSVKRLNLMQKYFKNPNMHIPHTCRSDFNLNINPSGDIFLCWEKPRIGNLLDDNPRKAWESKLAIQIRKQIIGCSRSCKLQNCNFD